MTGTFNITMEGVRSRWAISGPVVNDTWIINHFGVTPVLKNMKVSVGDTFLDGNREMRK